jgi:hypothetical protein
LLEQSLMTVLEGMVASGAADDRYDESRDLDSFISTERLVQNWSWVFRGEELKFDRSERHVFEIEGKRAQYFNDRWLVSDPSNPIPSWPNQARRQSNLRGKAHAETRVQTSSMPDVRIRRASHALAEKRSRCRPRSTDKEITRTESVSN